MEERPVSARILGKENGIGGAEVMNVLLMNKGVLKKVGNGYEETGKLSEYIHKSTNPYGPDRLFDREIFPELGATDEDKQTAQDKVSALHRARALHEIAVPEVMPEVPEEVNADEDDLKTFLIAGGILGAIALIGGTWYFIKKQVAKKTDK